MIPILFHAPFLKLYTFGVFLVLALLWGMFLFWKGIKLTEHKEEEMFDGISLAILGGLVLSRILYIVLHFDAFGFDPLKYILVNGYPGASVVGFFLGFFVVLWLYTRAVSISFAEMIDYTASPLLLALGIAKVGGFFAGVDVGSRTSFFLSTQFSGYEGMRHLTPLYEAVLFFIATWGAYKILYAIRREEYPRGMNFWYLLSTISGIYLLLDFLKENHVYLGPLSFNLIVAIPTFVISLGYMIFTNRAKFKFIKIPRVVKNKKK